MQFALSTLGLLQGADSRFIRMRDNRRECTRSKIASLSARKSAMSTSRLSKTVAS